MQSERNCLDITLDIVFLLLRDFHTRRTPDFYYTKRSHSHFYKSNARKHANVFTFACVTSYQVTHIKSDVISFIIIQK